MEVEKQGEEVKDALFEQMRAEMIRARSYQTLEQQIHSTQDLLFEIARLFSKKRIGKLVEVKNEMA